MGVSLKRKRTEERERRKEIFVKRPARSE